MSEKLECDLVMRGGITSGIVYPRAIAKLAETYNFRSIGGTSAGAIAAAGTAAAAYGASKGGTPFQDRFKDLPKELSDDDNGTKPTRLERLFQPQGETRPLFGVLMAGLGHKTIAQTIVNVVLALWRNYPLLTLLGAAIGLGPLFAFAFSSSLSGGWLVVLLVVGCVSGIAVMIVAAAGGAVWDILKRLPESGYGLCAGSDGPDANCTDDPPLTDWLHKFFQEVADRPLDEPLTFGQLWGAHNDPEKPRDIDLVLMTTNVTRGISQRLPFIEGSWGQLFFNTHEFAKLFPPPVVNWMREHAADVRHDEIDVPEGYHALPAPADLPILLGARMSLSFPFLLSAVPLYAANVMQKREDGTIPLQRCWFSDGGLTSNFPIHFFDAPLPTRPTFGINLVPETVAIGDEAPAGADKGAITGLRPGGKAVGEKGEAWDKIYMPGTNSSGIGSMARFNNFGSVGGFFIALFDTARNWADTELMAMPGYRDRIVHVALAKDEGGMNLNMPKEIIERIGERGEKAGALMAARFDPDPRPDPQSGKEIWLTWDNHRWVRFRSFVAALEDVVRRFRGGWTRSDQDPNAVSYEALLKRSPGSKPRSYQFGTNAQRDFVIEATGKLVDFVETWSTSDQTFDRGNSASQGRSPRPKPALRMRPLGSNDPQAERPGGPENNTV